MSLSIRSGPAAILDHGMVTGFLGAPLSLELVVDDETVCVELRFVDDPSSVEVAVRSVWLDDGIAFELVNFDDAEGRGSAKPVLLGELGEHLIFLHFRVFRFGETPDRTVHYTFYRVGKDDVGWTPR